MYPVILAVHFFFRWAVVLSLVFATYRAYIGWFSGKTFTKTDNLVRHITATIAHIQLVFGLWLYFISPLISYFLYNYHEAVHDRQIRFFGMEHSIMMLIAITIVTIGSAMAKRKTNAKEKFKTMAIWYSIALIIILLSVPWPFSPMVQRPYLRMV